MSVTDNSIKGRLVLTEHFKTFCEAFVVEFYIKLKLILRIITYLAYMFGKLIILLLKVIFWGDFSILKLFLKLSCYHDNYFQFFIFRKHNVLSDKARVSTCMYFLVILYSVMRFTYFVYTLL